jgi:hypothetical protein
MSYWEVALWFIWLLISICLFGCHESLICETLESVAVLGLVLSLGVENTEAIQEAFKFTWPGPVLPVVSQPFHHIDRMIHLPLLIVALGRATLVHVAWLLLLLSIIEDHLLCQGVFVGIGQHFFWCPGALHGELTEQRQVLESLLEAHDDQLIVNLRDDFSFVAKMLYELLKWLTLVLDDTS